MLCYWWIQEAATMWWIVNLLIWPVTGTVTESMYLVAKVCLGILQNTDMF